jgi:hypothetical protein
MKNLLLAGVIGFGVLVIGVGVAGVATYVSFANRGVELESGIDATYKNNRAVLAQYSLKVKEAMGVTDAYSADFERVVTESMEGRYGEDGAQAVVSWIKEAYPGQFDSQLYVQVQRIIESGRTDFQNAQSLLIDKCRVYENQRNYVWSGFWLKLAGYPKNLEQLTKACTPIESQHSQKTFDTGVDTGIEIN